MYVCVLPPTYPKRAVQVPLPRTLSGTNEVELIGSPSVQQLHVRLDEKCDDIPRPFLAAGS